MNDKKFPFEYDPNKCERCSSQLVMLIMQVQENQGKGGTSRRGYALIVGCNIKS